MWREIRADEYKQFSYLYQRLPEVRKMFKALFADDYSCSGALPRSWAR
jgi:hypothetical protein